MVITNGATQQDLDRAQARIAFAASPAVSAAGGATPASDVPRGLKGVVVTETVLGDVRGREGFYHYRQYSAVELAERRSLEDVWHLLLFGELPDAAARARFAARVAPLRRIPDGVAELLPGLAREGRRAGAGTLDGLRTALSLAGSARGVGPLYDADEATRIDDALFAAAVTPTLVAALYRLGQGLVPIAPRDDLPFAANYLHMVTGVEPTPVQVRAIERYLVCTVDHGFNASTFTARVIASTGADLVACVVGAIGALSGPLHGGAPSRALDTLDAIGSPERIDPWIREHVLAGDRIMGFGHPVYRTEDPRSRLLRGVAEEFGGELVTFATQVERRVVELLAELKPGRKLHTNVEFYAGVVMELCGLAREMFTPTFAVARTLGWTANILEQAADSKIIRPSARYAGPPPPQQVPAP
ncbi:citrate/2-methylcitrate synthase [Frankia sp. AgB32]|uniref:citrate/2-methylcitrate synthase n=1 Tax=Frankia sp. AgB32 TaxID=631119 RepID=UPI002010032B|nr:citrate/2-methylcitrate synthase [Frankia sp. AgB32]MCK9894166.1 citrate synthase/methylcitrate synthase [Frankia sp. AgB32]